MGRRGRLHHQQGSRAFTLIELLVTIGIIAIIAGVTVITYQTVAQGAKLASGKNTVMAALDQARSLAMKQNRIVMVAFRPVLDGNQQRLEAVFAQYAGTGKINVTGPGWQVVDKFAPIPNIPAKQLPRGIKVASPGYGAGNDFLWITPSHFPIANEYPGEVVAIMYAADGTTISRNTATDSARTWIDFDGDGMQTIGTGGPIDYFAPTSPPGTTEFNDLWFEHGSPDQEPYVDIAAFIVVFDDDECRELYDVNTWVLGFPMAELNRNTDYTAYITNNADPIHFNRYTGVVMK